MKVLLVHPGKQHSFETAKALKEAGVFYKYVTTVYDKGWGSHTNIRMVGIVSSSYI